MIEFEGKTIDDAIENACRKLEAPREKLNVEIVSEGTPGFFGLGSKRAKIKARLMNIHIEEEAVAVPTVEPTYATLPIAPKPALKPAHTPIPKSVPRASVHTAGDIVESGQREGKFLRKEPLPETQEGDRELGAKAQTILSGILARMNIEAPVTVDISDDAIVLNIKGDGGGLIIGKRGQNLDALQYIVNKAANRSGEERKMIIIDTEAYRKRREDALASLAERLGQKVKKTRKAVTVSHMNAHDRRIIHLTLQGDSSLITKSRGEGEYRKIIIMPARRERDKTAIKTGAN